MDLNLVATKVAELAATQAEAAAPAAEAVQAAASWGPIGAGIAAVGAGIGIGKLAAHAMDAVARQPEAADKITGNMILTAAFVEGVALFAVVVGLLGTI